MIARSLTSCRHAPALVSGSMLVATMCGCKLFGGGTMEQPTQLDRLMAAYPELGNGRFVVIADFEDPRQMEIIHLESASLRAKCTLGQRGGRRQTGGKCVEFVAASERDAIVLNNEDAANWYLKRDWRDYDLLLIQMKSPRSGLTAEVSLSGGDHEERSTIRSSIHLREGWNTIRLDLADVGEHIALDDVQSIRISIGGAQKPAKVYIDDIILADSSKDLSGNSSNRHGDIYVRRTGRRWIVGVGGRFELTFANGQIVRWYNLVSDPYRVRNLVEGTVLGPSVVVLDADGRATSDLSRLGNRVIAHSRILEMSTVRVVLSCDWSFAPEDRPAGSSNPTFQTWIYTIYPSGQIYVAAEQSEQAGHDATSRLGYAVTIATGGDARVFTNVHSGAKLGGPSESPAYAVARSSRPNAILLFVPGNPRSVERLTEEIDVERNRISLVAVTKEGRDFVQPWSCQLFVGTGAGEVSDNELRERAAGYIQPPELQFELGEPIGRGDQGVDGTGFDRLSGCFVIAPDAGRVRFRIDARKHPCYSPAFRILSEKDAQAWVYVNHFVFDDVARDPDGNLIFQLPGIVRGETLVEVLFTRPPTLEES